MTPDPIIPSPRYRATLNDGDTSRERPLTIYGNSLPEIRTWAGQVLPGALEGAGVNVYMLQEVHVELITKKKAEGQKP